MKRSSRKVEKQLQPESDQPWELWKKRGSAARTRPGSIEKHVRVKRRKVVERKAKAKGG